MEIETPHGPARAHLHPVDAPRAALVLGHGAGGGVQAPDLQIARDVGNELRMTVALVEQPYRVAGRKSAAPAPKLDEAWIAIVAALGFEVPVITGGRSSGARVACRTAAATAAHAVLCLAFPLIAPSGSRQHELDAVDVPVLIVQGTSDRFGMPEPGANRQVVQVRGDHGLKSDRPAVREAIRDWLTGLLA